MKKILCLAFALALALTLAACAPQNAPSNADAETVPETNAETVPEMPETHAIAYPENYPTAQDEYGADAFAGALNHPDSRYYAVNDFYHMQSDDSLHILSNFETYQQTTEYTCGTAAALMVLHWFGEDGYDEMSLCDLVEIDQSKGTSVEGMVKFFQSIGWDVDFHADTDYRFESIEDAQAYLLDRIDAGIPVMVDWVDWAGHWQVVIGLDECGTDSPYDDVLILADPYDVTDHYQDGYYTFPLGRFFDMWREGPCAQKTEPYLQPFVAAQPAADAAAVTDDAASNDLVADETKTIQIGASAFSLAIPAHFPEGELTQEDIEDDTVAYYRSDETLMYFDLYQFSKEGYPDTLAEFVAQEAAEYNASEIVTDAEINGIPVGYYRSVEESDGVEYNVITYAFEDNGEYAEVAFWLDGDTAQAEADAIINTLSK